MASLSEVTRQQLIEARERRAKEGKLDAVARLDRAITQKEKQLAQQSTFQEIKRHFAQGAFGAVGSMVKGGANTLDLVNLPGEQTLDELGKYISTPGVNTETDPKASDIGEIKDFGSGVRVLTNLAAQSLGSVAGYSGTAAALGLGARALAPVAVGAVPLATLYLMGMGEARQAQEAAGIEDKHAGAAAGAGAIIALLERLGLEGAIGNKITGQAAKKIVQSKAMSAGTNTLIEGVTEPSQDIVAKIQANLVAEKPWDDGLTTPEALKEYGTDAIAGALTGGIGGATFAYQGQKAPPKPGAPEGATEGTPPPPSAPKPTPQAYPPTATVGKKPGPMSEVRTTQIPPAKVKEIVQNVAGELATFKKGRWFVPKSFESPLQETFDSYLESIGAKPTVEQRAELEAQSKAARDAEAEAGLVQTQQDFPIEAPESGTQDQLTDEATAIGTYGEDPGFAPLSLPPTPAPTGLPLTDPSIAQAGEYIMGLESPDRTIPYYPPNEIEARNLTHAIMYRGDVYSGKTHFDILQNLQQNVMREPDGTLMAPDKVDAELDRAFVGFTTPSGEFLTQDDVRRSLGTATTAGVAEAALLENVDLRTETNPYVPASPNETQTLRDLHKRGKVSRVMLPGKRKYGYFPVGEEEAQTQQAEAGLVARVRPVEGVQPTPVQGKAQYTGTEALPNAFAVRDERGATLVVPLLDPESHQSLLGSMREYLNRVAPGASLVPAKISNGQMSGLADPINQLIYYSLQHGKGLGTASHEVIHLLKDKFTPEEWALLSEKSRRKWIKEFGVDQQPYTKDERIEEGVAQGYSAFNAGVGKFEPAVRRAFTKLKNILTKTYNFLRRKGYTSPEDIFRKVESGEVGRRTGRQSGDTSPVYTNPNWRTIPFGQNYRELVINSKDQLNVGQTHWSNIKSPIVHARLIDNTLEDGTPVVSIVELQSDVDLELQATKTQLRLEKGASPLPVPPMRIALRAAIRDAVQRGIGTIAWPGSAEHVKLWGDQNRQGFTRVYDEMIPNELKKFAKQYGGELGTSKVIDEETGNSIPVNTFTIPKGFAREVTGGIYKWQLAEADHPSPSVSWSTKLVDRFNKLRSRFFSVYGDLPDIDQIRAIRYLTLGKITEAGELVNEASTALKDATEHDKTAILDYFQTKEAVPPTLDNPTLGKHIQKFKESIRQTSAKLFELGLLTEDQYNTYEDQYLPYVYYWHLLDQDQRQALGSGNRASPLNNLKARDPSLDELTRMVMGQIKDPTYLLAKVFGQQMRDIALIEGLNQIAQNEQWVWKDAIVDYNGRPVTTHWLATTADKIDMLLEHENAYPTPEAKAEAIRRRDEMRALVTKQHGTKYDSKQFTEVPDHPRYGALAGLPIRNEIYAQFIDSVHMANSMANSKTGAKLMGLVDKGTQLWKLGKVPLNAPVSFARAAIGGMIQMHSFGGMSAFSIPGELYRAFKDFQTNSERFKRAKKWGVVNTTYTTGELAEIERMLTAGQTFKFDPDHLFAPVLGLAESIIHIGAKSAKTVADAYGLIDQIYKTAMINYHVDQGMSEQDAALLAHDAIFDYSEIGPMLAGIRKLPIAGSPFFTFTAKAVTQTTKLLGNAMKDPATALRLVPYLIFPYMATALASAASGLDDDDARKIRKLLPDTLRDNPYVIPLPVIDEKGGIGYFDGSYYFPWQVLIQLGIIASNVDKKGVGPSLLEGAEQLSLAGGAFSDLFTALKTGYDAFTGKPITNQFAPPGEQNLQLAAYLWSYFMPPSLAYKPEGASSGRRGLVQKIVEAHQGKMNPYTQVPYLMPEQAWAGLLGVNVYRTDPIKQRAVALRYRTNQLENIKRTAQKQLRNPNLSPEQRKALLAAYKEHYETQADRLRQYADETNFSSKVRDLQRGK